MTFPVPCPGCGRFVRSDVVNCPHCGLLRPGERWSRKWRGWFRPDGHGFVRYLIWTNATLFVLSLVLFPSGVELTANPFRLLTPSGKALFLLGEGGAVPLAYGRWWTLLAANYLHGGILHIFFNMAALTQVGPLAVRVYGPARAFAVYTLGGVAGFFVSAMAGTPYSVGASAALCSLIGACLYYGKHRGGTFGTAVFQTLWGWAVGIFLFGFFLPGIDNWAHGGGMAAGFLLGNVLGYEERRAESAWQRWLGAACVGATALALLWGAGTGLLLRLLG